MAYNIKKDSLNEYFTVVINELLKELDFKEIQPNELRNCSILSKSQGTNRPETNVYIFLKDYSKITITFKKGKITSSGWLHFNK